MRLFKKKRKHPSIPATEKLAQAILDGKMKIYPVAGDYVTGHGKVPSWKIVIEGWR